MFLSGLSLETYLPTRSLGDYLGTSSETFRAISLTLNRLKESIMKHRSVGKGLTRVGPGLSSEDPIQMSLPAMLSLTHQMET